MDAENYNKNGFDLYKQFFKEEELLEIEPILRKFHQFWLKENLTYYRDGLINSHSITGSKHINKQEKDIIFQFISQSKLTDLLAFKNSKFLNTQLFFDPKNKEQKNYWHRDIQYTGLSDLEQKELIKTQNVVHLRIPFTKEFGIELIPKTHRIWDTKQQYEVRNNLNNRKNSDSLENSKLIPLDRKDLLLFSANMIHRGIYGNNRFSLDIIFCDDNPQVLKFRELKNLPTKHQLLKIDNKEIF